ncbi:aspartate-semialdehyde dehydrogenase [Proteinivorax hydrogeniformans]|uniref:Aspartate-semialdehyde dehydrogenase n=1 Tax=Proteinivorax hydrogeniformans TaxID=1826727 RepID=A0AAU8HQF2_9FIRM
MKKANLAIVGATGMVGQTIKRVLEERDFPVNNILFLASKRSAGKKVMFKGKEHVVLELTENSFKDIDIALFSAGGEISKKFAPIAKESGAVVVDNSSAWRMDDDVPLVVPEVNPEDAFSHKGIISNPNCSTIQAVLPLKVLDDLCKIKRVVYSTYQAVSGSGVAGVDDLKSGVQGKEPKNYPHPIAFNCLPHIDVFMDDGYTKEERKMIDETKKILKNSKMGVTATTVRVPVENGHSLSVNVELEKPYNLQSVLQALNDKEGIVVLDDIKNNVYPMAINAHNTDDVYVGRLRRDFSLENGLNLWVVADNIRKGASTNTVQIAELLLKED